ncbi:lipid A deacylase LpxR family protein [Undibacterium sp. TJN25]|uniref:lipid A deacylase LpxR family protein n=1 Tax=Undibacterium sp. TJN25 TaxID=3413056 RepID=UPI003BF2FFDD
MQANNPIFSAVLAAALAPASLPTLAQSVLPSVEEYRDVQAKGISVWQLTVENDSLLFNDKDGFYTSGVQLGQRSVLNTQSNSTSYGWRIGQELYTASDTKLLPSQLSPRDHPYAGWLFGGVYKEIADASGSSTRIGLDFGCLGPCAGGYWAQTHLHRLLHQPLPQGWSTQLGNEWGAVLSGEWSPVRWAPASYLDITPRFKGRFGNIFTDASFGLTLRAGALDRLPEQPASYAFFRAEAKAVAYTATIQGGYFANEHTGVDPKRGVGELELGYVWRGERFGANVSVIRRSDEIRQLTNAEGAQNFAKIQFFYAM